MRVLMREKKREREDKRQMEYKWKNDLWNSTYILWNTNDNKRDR